MGLDWNPGNKPKPGFEAEYEEIVRAVNSGKAKDENAALARFHEISIAAYETLQAPRVGHDEKATQWAKKIYDEQKPDQPEEEWLEEYKGYYVLDLVPECDGLPRYSNAPLGYIEAFSFRAQFLDDCRDILGDELLESAYEHKSADELLAYGRELVEKAERHADQQGVDLGQLNKKPREDVKLEGVESQLDIMLSAGRWCIFWGERGHMLDPYY